MIVDHLFILGNAHGFDGDIRRLTPTERLCVMTGDNGDLRPYSLLELADEIGRLREERKRLVASLSKALAVMS
jgi:hypothetical protein